MSEVSEDFISEYDGVSPRFGDTLELSASVIDISNDTGGRTSDAKPANLEEPLAPTERADSTRWRRIETQVLSLTRSLAMLKDIREKQQEYLSILRSNMG